MKTRRWKPDDDWFHESRVQQKIKSSLKNQWGIPISEANALTREPGPDLLFKKNNRHLRVEVKGYPSDKYTRGKMRGQKKITNPRIQAPHWFGDALLTLIIAKSEDQTLQIAIGLPRCDVYEKKWKAIHWVAEKIRLKCFWVEKSGGVVCTRP